MESRDELKEIDIENSTCYYFDFSIFLIIRFHHRDI